MYKYYLIQGEAITEVPEPVGWDKMETVLKRHPEKHGVGVEFSEVQLSFYCGEGYAEIFAEYTANGSDGEMQFRQDYECDSITYPGPTFSINFNGLLHVPGEYVQVNLENVSFNNLLNTRDKTKVNMGSVLSIDGDAITPASPSLLHLHSRTIQKQFDAEDLTGASDTFTFAPEDSAPTQLWAQKSWDTITLNEIQGVFNYFTAWQQSNIVTAGEWLIDIEEAGIYTFDIQIKYALQIYTALPDRVKNLEFRWILRIDEVEYDLTNGINVPGYIDQTPANYYSGTLAATITHTEALPVGSKVYLFAYQDHDHASENFDPEGPQERVFTLYTFADSFITITALTQTQESDCHAWPVKDVLRQVLYGITGHNNRFKSDYFDGCGNKYLLTDGFLLRQFPDKSLTVSKDDIWNGLQPIFALGEGVALDGPDEVVEVEQIPYFYQESEILKIDAPDEYSEEVAGEYIYNSIEVGYEKYNTDEFNALDEFNSKREYQTPVKSSENRLNATSKFVASMYAIESQRRKPYEAGAKVSGTFDKDTFIVSALPAPFREWSIAGYPNANTVQIHAPTAVTDYFDLNSVPDLLLVGAGANNGTYTRGTVTQPGPNLLNIAVTPAIPNTGISGGSVEIYSTFEAYQAEKDEPFAVTGNILSPETMYNGRISPVRNMLRWSYVVNSGLWFKDPAANSLRFASGEGNTNFYHQFNPGEACKDGDPLSAALAENKTILLNENNEFRMLWKPEYITFKAPLTAGQMQLIRAAHIPQVDAEDKHGYISVWDGEEYQQGYLLELRFKDADQTGELSTFKLIKKWNSPLPIIIITHLEFSDEFSDEFN